MSSTSLRSESTNNVLESHDWQVLRSLHSVPFRSLQLQPLGVLNLCLEHSFEWCRWQGLCLLRWLSVRPYEVLGGKVLEPSSCRKMVQFQVVHTTSVRWRGDSKRLCCWAHQVKWTKQAVPWFLPSHAPARTRFSSISDTDLWELYQVQTPQNAACLKKKGEQVDVRGMGGGGHMAMLFLRPVWPNAGPPKRSVSEGGDKKMAQLLCRNDALAKQVWYNGNKSLAAPSAIKY